MWKLRCDEFFGRIGQTNKLTCDSKIVFDHKKPIGFKSAKCFKVVEALKHWITLIAIKMILATQQAFPMWYSLLECIRVHSLKQHLFQ